MSKTNNKMNHTKGELRINKHSKTNVDIDLDGVTRSIASTGGYQSNVDSERIYNENIANAARLVKCWNMHDELVRKIKLFIELQEEVLVFIDKEQFQTVKAFIDSSKELINQSEQ